MTWRIYNKVIKNIRTMAAIPAIRGDYLDLCVVQQELIIWQEAKTTEDFWHITLCSFFIYFTAVGTQLDGTIRPAKRKKTKRSLWWTCLSMICVLYLASYPLMAAGLARFLNSTLGHCMMDMELLQWNTMIPRHVGESQEWLISIKFLLII